MTGRQKTNQAFQL